MVRVLLKRILAMACHAHYHHVCSMLSSVQKGLKISPINTVGKRGR
jgi:hypothetical protein